MAACVCVVDLKAIHHTGKFIGDDWLYVLGVNGRRGTLRGNGKNKVYPPGERPRWALVTPTCGDRLRLDITIRAVEEDLVFNDENPELTRLHTKVIVCPGPDASEPGKLIDQVIQVPVTEDYGLFKGKTNKVAFTLDIVAHHHADIDASAEGAAEEGGTDEEDEGHG